MLFFEFFPLFMAAVSVLVGIWLVMADRKAREDPSDPGLRRVEPPNPGQKVDHERVRRPSMSA